MEGRREEDPALRSWSERMTSAVVIAIVSQQGVGGGAMLMPVFLLFLIKNGPNYLLGIPGLGTGAARPWSQMGQMQRSNLASSWM